MTVSEIKEYINNRMKHYVDLKLRKMGERGHYPFFKQKIVQELFNIKSMLDELEPQAKWLYSADEDEAPYYRCSNCGDISNDGTEYICKNCGARMNDELKSEDTELKEEDLGLWEVEDDFYGNRN